MGWGSVEAGAISGAAAAPRAETEVVAGQRLLVSLGGLEIDMAVQGVSIPKGYASWILVGVGGPDGEAFSLVGASDLRFALGESTAGPYLLEVTGAAVVLDGDAVKVTFQASDTADLSPGEYLGQVSFTQGGVPLTTRFFGVAVTGSYKEVAP